MPYNDIYIPRSEISRHVHCLFSHQQRARHCTAASGQPAVMPVTTRSKKVGIVYPHCTSTEFDFLSLLQSKPSCAVVGGGGFLGRHLLEMLLERGYRVSSFDICKPQPSQEREGVAYFTGDLCIKEV